MADMPADLVINTADVEVEPEEEPKTEEAKAETPVAKEEPKAEAPVAKEEPKIEAPKEDAPSSDVLALVKEALSLREDVKTLKAELEAMTKRATEAEAFRSQAGKSKALREAGLPEEWARFLSEDEGKWAEDIETLKITSETKTTAPRDPAADADAADVNEEKYVRNFLGLR